MAEKVFLHVGAPKSGTTYLQSVLWANQSTLADAGILLPGQVMFDHNRAAAAVTARPPRQKARETWRRMVRAVNRWDGVAIFSNEWFSRADEDQAAVALAAFQDAETHVVFTARDFVGVAPAAWQERLKLGHAQPLAEFIGELDRPGDQWSWWTLDPAEVLTRWGASLPPERVHVVTVPPRGSAPDLLWNRFADVCGIPPGRCDLATTVANESLGVESARLLQLLGPRLREAIGADEAAWTHQYKWLRRYLGHDLLVPRGGSKIGLREDEVAALRARTERSVALLRKAGYAVAGDLADLSAAEVPSSAVHPDDVSDQALLEVANDLVVALLGRLSSEAP